MIHLSECLCKLDHYSPARTAQTAGAKPVLQSTAERLKKLDELFKSGAITKGEYDAKRKEILDSL
ncbi:MAG: SHOCT domain-containing protein [Sulfuriferula sp.]